MNAESGKVAGMPRHVLWVLVTILSMGLVEAAFSRTAWYRGLDEGMTVLAQVGVGAIGLFLFMGIGLLVRLVRKETGHGDAG